MGRKTGMGRRRWRRAVLSVALVSGFAACAPSLPDASRSDPPAGVRGRVAFEGEPLAGATVSAYRTLDDYRSRVEAAISSPTDEGGDFTLDIPPGRYYAAAAGESADGTLLYGFHGSNPLNVPPGRFAVVGFSLSALPLPPDTSPLPAPDGGKIAGMVVSAGAPLAGAIVNLYLDGESDFKGSPYAASFPTGEDGRFEFENLVETEYYLVARKRSGGRRAGPLGPGDRYGFYPFNPVTVKGGMQISVHIETIAKSDDPVTENPVAVAGTAKIEGKVVGADGRPLAGLYAFIYPDRIMSHAKPLSISEPTAADGRFVLLVSGGGTFYLGARERYGLNPQPGERYGKYTGSPDHSITLEEGAVKKGVVIIVEPIFQ